MGKTFEEWKREVDQAVERIAGLSSCYPQRDGVATMKLLILDHATMQAPIVDIEEFALANADDPELIEDCRCLAKGFGFTVGGGAAPAFTISRWS